MKYKLPLLVLLTTAGNVAFAQTKIKDGTVTGSGTLPNSAAILELESSNKGLLLPRVTLTNTTTWGLSGTPVAGMMVYDTAMALISTNPAYPTLPGVRGGYFWDGNGWVGAGSGNFWKLNGNSGTNAGTSQVGNTADGNYWGTNDASQLVIGTNNTKRMIFDTSGNAWGGKNNVVANAGTQDLDNGSYPATSFMWGVANIDSSYQNTIFGTKNVIKGHLHSNIIAGEQDTIGGYWGWGNAVFGVKNAVTLFNGGGNIVGGIENKRAGTATSSGNAGILSGYQNTDSSYFSSIVGGSNNMVGPGGGNSLVSGSLNTIATPAFAGWNQGIAHSNAVFGTDNTINSTTASSVANANIIAGSSNTVTNVSGTAVFGASNIDSADNSLVAGQSNILTANAQSSISGGGNNYLKGNNSAVFGYQNKDSADFTLISGYSNILTSISSGTMAGGSNNYTSARNSMVVGNGDTIRSAGNNDGNFVSGMLNTIDGTATTDNNTVGGGNNKLYNVSHSFVHGDTNKDSSSHTFIAGAQNYLGVNAEYSALLGSANHIAGNSSTPALANIMFGSSNLISSNSETNIQGQISNNYNVVTGTVNTMINSVGTIIGGQINYSRKNAFSIVVGNQDTLYNASSAAVFGTFNTDSASHTLVAGYNNIAGSNMTYAAVIGKFNKPVNNSLFLVGNGNSNSTRSNAITVMGTDPAPAATGNSSTLNVNGSVSTSIRTINSNYIVQSNDHTIIVSASAPTGTDISLPAPTAPLKGMEIIIGGDAPTLNSATITGNINDNILNAACASCGGPLGGSPAAAFKFQCGETNAGSGIYTWWRIH